MTIAAVVCQSLIDLRTELGGPESEVGAVVLTLFVGSSFLLALRASGLSSRWQRWVDLLVGIGMVAVLAGALVDVVADVELPRRVKNGPSIARALIAVITPMAVLRRLARHRHISMRSLAGAISAYVLIALAANYVFVAVDVVQSSPFFGQHEPTTSYMYFSLVTLTTLGYGDLRPVTDLGRLMATSEAVIGQMFLVTVVAMVIGLLVQGRNLSNLDSGDEPTSS